MGRHELFPINIRIDNVHTNVRNRMKDILFSVYMGYNIPRNNTDLL